MSAKKTDVDVNPGWKTCCYCVGCSPRKNTLYNFNLYDLFLNSDRAVEMSVK